MQIRRQTQLSRHIGHTLVTFVLGKVWIYKAVGWGHGDFRWRQSPSHPPIGWGQIWISSRNENCQKQIERDRLYLMSRYWRCQKSMPMSPQLIVYQKKFVDPLLFKLIKPTIYASCDLLWVTKNCKILWQLHNSKFVRETVNTSDQLLLYVLGTIQYMCV